MSFLPQPDKAEMLVKVKDNTDEKDLVYLKQEKSGEQKRSQCDN